MSTKKLTQAPQNGNNYDSPTLEHTFGKEFRGYPEAAQKYLMGNIEVWYPLIFNDDYAAVSNSSQHWVERLGEAFIRPSSPKQNWPVENDVTYRDIQKGTLDGLKKVLSNPEGRRNIEACLTMLVHQAVTIHRQCGIPQSAHYRLRLQGLVAETEYTCSERLETIRRILESNKLTCMEIINGRTQDILYAPLGLSKALGDSLSEKFEIEKDGREAGSEETSQQDRMVMPPPQFLPKSAPEQETALRPGVSAADISVERDNISRPAARGFLSNSASRSNDQHTDGALFRRSTSVLASFGTRQDVEELLQRSKATPPPALPPNPSFIAPDIFHHTGLVAERAQKDLSTSVDRRMPSIQAERVGTPVYSRDVFNPYAAYVVDDDSGEEGRARTTGQRGTGSAATRDHSTSSIQGGRRGQSEASPHEGEDLQEEEL